MLSRFIVYFSYYLKACNAYKRCKRFFWHLLEDQSAKLKSRFDMLMIALIISSIFLLFYDFEHETSVIGGYAEIGIVIIFILEYLLRLWIYSDTHNIIIDEYERALYLNIKFNLSKALKKALATKIEYIVSPYAIIDLLAILPSYRPLRILRVFLIFRLFKLFRYSNSIKLFAEVLASKRYELLTLLIFTGFFLFIASVSVYIFEHQESGTDIHNLFDAFYWSIVTLATVGYGDITPHTAAGRMVAMILIFTSVGIVAFFTSILIAAFNEKMPELRENKMFAELEAYKNFIIICGFGRVGQEIANQLSKDGEKFIIIDKDRFNVDIARKRKYLAILNDASRNDILTAAGINRGARSILCITGDDVVNVYITLTSRYLNKDIHIISRANRHENVDKLYQAGANNVILPFEVAGLLAAEFLGQPVAFEAISGILREQSDIVMETVLVTEQSPLDNQKIGSLDLLKRKLTLLGVISANKIHLKHKNKYRVKQQHFYFNPEPNFILRHGDILVVLGRKYGIEHFRSQVEQQRLLGKVSK
ncbi:MAG: NAD-binding protein [Gammaproteobacteria bacterium]